MPDFLQKMAALCAFVMFVLMIFGGMPVVAGGVLSLVVGSAPWWVLVFASFSAMFSFAAELVKMVW